MAVGAANRVKHLSQLRAPKFDLVCPIAYGTVVLELGAHHPTPCQRQ